MIRQLAIAFALFYTSGKLSFCDNETQPPRFTRCETNQATRGKFHSVVRGSRGSQHGRLMRHLT